MCTADMDVICINVSCVQSPKQHSFWCSSQLCATKTIIKKLTTGAAEIAFFQH
jgi:hypothetical protein